MEILAIPHATNRSRPTGGVIRPMAKFTTMIKPKWIGFTPTALASGSNSGVRTIIAELASRKQPAMSSRMLINSRIRTLLLNKLVAQLTTMFGKFSIMMT
jgi:hypothetical protein